MTDVAQLKMLAEMNDRASAPLKSLRGEIDKNSEALERIKKVQKDNAEVDAIFVRSKDRKLSALAEERRALIEKARAEKVASVEAAASGNALSGIYGKVRLAANILPGLGISGIIGAAAAGVVALTQAIVGYNSALKTAQENQERFNQLIDELNTKGREFQLSQMTPEGADWARASDSLEELTTKYLDFQHKREDAEVAIQSAQERIVELRARDADAQKRGVLSASTRAQHEAEIRDLQREIYPIAESLTRARLAESRALDLIHQKQQDANLTLQVAKGVYKDIEASLSASVTFAGNLGAALAKAFSKVSWNPLGLFGTSEADDVAAHKKEEEEAERQRKADARRGAGMAAAKRERERDLADKLARDQVAYATESEFTRKLAEATFDRDIIERDFAAKKLSATERQLKLDAIELDLMIAQREEADKAFKAREEAAEKAKKTKDELDEKRKKSAKELAEKTAKAHKEEIEGQAKAIEMLGDAAARSDGPLERLTGRLAGLGSTIRETASIWADYTRGQTRLGDAVASTLGVIGAQVAQAISDRRSQALVEGGFESAAAIASYASGNIPAGIGHTEAAAAFFALAAAGGGKSSGARGGGRSSQQPSSVIQGSFGQPRSGSSRPEDTRQLIIIQSRDGGIIYGTDSSVAKFATSTARSLQGTNMGRPL